MIKNYPKFLASLLFVFIFQNLLFAVKYTSIGSGDWSTPSIWDSGIAPSEIIQNSPDEVEIAAGHTVTITTAGLQVKVGATLTVRGYLIVAHPDGVEVFNGAILAVQAGGTLECTAGTVRNNATGTVINGTLLCTGDFEAGNGSVISGVGTVEIQGSLTNGGTIMGQTVECDGCALTVDGYSYVFYLDPLGNDGNDGTSATSPLRTISAALTKINANTHDGTIELANGTYDQGGADLIIGYSTTFNGASQAGTIINNIGTLTVNSSLTLTINNATITSSVCNVAGILSVGEGGLCDVDGPFDATTGQVTFSGSGTLACSQDVLSLGNLSTSAGTVEFDGSIQQSIIEPEVFYNLKVNNSAGLDLRAPITINGNLNFTDGDILSDIFNDPPVNILTIASGGTFSGASNSSHVVGPMDYVIAGTDETAIPVGDGSNYRPVYITPASGGSTYTAQYYNSAHSLGTNTVNTGFSGVLDHVAPNIYWDIDNNGGALATVGLGWNTTIGVDVPADMRLCHWNGTAWEAIGHDVAGTASSGKVAGAAQSFSPFNLGSGSGNNPLPVDLLSFTADCSHDIVDINFSVISQVNNDYFLLEKSKDAIEWEEVGTLEGAGTTNSQMDYSIVDGAADHGLSYYRLTQVDYDGTSKTFAPVSASCESLGSGLPIEVYPNPMINEVTFELDLDEYQGNEVYYTILDARGSIVLRDNMELSRGFNKQTIDVQNLPKGVYILRFNNTKDHITEKRLVKK